MAVNINPNAIRPDNTHTNAVSAANSATNSASSATAAATSATNAAASATSSSASATKSQNWATQTGSDVTGEAANSRSAKSWAQESLTGATLGGSAKDWAQSGSLPDGVSKSAKSYSSDAQASATQAANYAAAAATGAKFFNTIALGNAGVADAATFGVIAGGSDGLKRPSIYRRESAGVSTLLYSVLPASEYDQNIDTTSSSDYSWYVQDSLGGVGLALKPDGTLVGSDAEFTNVNGTPTTTLAALPSLALPTDPSDYVWYLVDTLGNIAAALSSTGAMTIADVTATTGSVTSLTVSTINGVAPGDLATLGTSVDNGNYPAEICFINNTGQSLGEGSSPATAITTAQEYNNVGFAAGDSAPTSFLPLTVANTQENNAGLRGENPMYGFCSFLQELILKEEGVAYTGHNFQLCAASNALGGASVTGISKGTAEYNCAEAQVAAGYSLAQAAGKTWRHVANLYTQGEADSAMSRTTYKTNLKQLATDYNADSNAAVPGNGNVLTISYQVSTAGNTVPLAQLDAHDELPSLIRVATPIYWMQPTYDGIHINATFEKWLGAYYALVFKRVVVDQGTWEPLRINSVLRQGKLLFVKYKVPKRRDGKITKLVFDTTTLPAIANMGFTLVDAANSPLTISAVEIAENDTVKITAAATVAAGSKLQYGMNTVSIAATNTGSYVRGAGNLRDSYGNYVTFDAIGKPMHNWATINEYVLS